jgi:hypothetical protein
VAAKKPTAEEQRLLDYKNEPLFHAYADLKNLKELPWVIKNISHEEEINVFAALPKNNKTWMLLAVAYALLSGEPLFGHEPFAATKGKKFVYLIPEVGIRPFWKRVKTMKLEPFVKDGSLLIRSLSMAGKLALDDERLLRAVEGADVAVDTFVRYIGGDESSASDIANGLAEKVMGLVAGKARSVWGAHHSPKEFAKQRTMSMENMLRGSGDIGAFVSNAYGLRQLDKERNLVHVECLGSRDLDVLVKPFQLTGFPYISDIGNFRMTSAPGVTGRLEEYLGGVGSSTPGRKATLNGEQLDEAIALSKAGKSNKDIAAALTKSGTKTSSSAVQRALAALNVKGQDND